MFMEGFSKRGYKVSHTSQLKFKKTNIKSNRIENLKVTKDSNQNERN